MTIWILTLFPKVFSGIFQESIISRAQNDKRLKIRIINIRDFAEDKRKTVDDKPYGGGQGMLLKVDVVVKALESIKKKPHSILLSPSGLRYNQQTAISLSKKKSIALICGHYEGVDARVEKFVDKTISIGDFVLTGGEIPAMAIIDSVTRLLPDVIQKESLESESFSQIGNCSPGEALAKPGKLEIGNLLEYPQYTRPQNFRGLKVPKILLSGNHEKIKNWKKKESLKTTKKYRPDLLESKH